MKTIILGVLILLITIAGALAIEIEDNQKIPQRFILQETPSDYMPGIMAIKVNNPEVLEEIRAKFPFVKESYKATPIKNIDPVAKKLGLERQFLIKVPENLNGKRFKKALERIEGVEWAETNNLVPLTSVPNDPNFGIQWALENMGQEHTPGVSGTPDADIDAPEAWDWSTGSGVVIAIIDTGVDMNHPDLINKFWVNPGEDLNNNGIADYYSSGSGGDLDGIDADANCDSQPGGFPPFESCVDDLIGWDFLFTNFGTCTDDDCGAPTDNNLTDNEGHGTSVAGIVGAETDNGIGVAGTCPECELMIMRACFKSSVGSGGECSMLAATWSVYYAVQNGADIISMSFAGPVDDNLLRPALQYANQQGLVLVAGAGNTFGEAIQYPAGYDYVTAIANTDYDDSLASSSTRGNWIDLTAPGVNIYTTDWPAQYNYFGGTSASAPFVAGVAGLILSANPGLQTGDAQTQTQVNDLLRNGSDNISAQNPGNENKIGSGRLNAYNSVCLALGGCTLPNNPPIMIKTPTENYFVKNVGETVSFTVNVSDPDNETVNVTWQRNQGSGNWITVGTGTNYQLSSGTKSVHIMKVQATDGTDTVTEEFRVIFRKSSPTKPPKYNYEMR